MKILLVHNFYQQPGGEDTVFARERSLLERAGHEVCTYTRSNHELDRAGTLVRIASATRTVWSSSSRRDFARVLREQTPDVVHVHNTFLVISPSIFAACSETSVPVVNTLHNYRLFCPAANFVRDGEICERCVQQGLWRSVWHGCYRNSRVASAVVATMLAANRCMRTWTRRIDRFIVLTKFARDKFVDAGLPEAKIRLKPNFISPDPGERAGAGDFALFVGRLAAEKGVQTLVRALGKMASSVPFRVVGDGPLRPHLEQCASGQRELRFLGALSHEDTLATMKRARFLVVPSECYEMFPLVIVEAFACGVPVVTSKLGSLPELVQDGRTGLLFRSADACDLAAKITWAWNHPAEMSAMGRRARAEYLGKYTGEQNLRRLEQIYGEAIAERNAIYERMRPQQKDRIVA